MALIGGERDERSIEGTIRELRMFSRNECLPNSSEDSTMCVYLVWCHELDESFVYTFDSNPDFLAAAIRYPIHQPHCEDPSLSRLGKHELSRGALHA